MGYVTSIRDGEDEYDLDYVERAMGRLRALYMKRTSKHEAEFRLRAFIPGPKETWKFYFECSQGSKMLEKTRIQEWVWDAYTKGKKTELYDGGIEFFTIETFKPGNMNEKKDKTQKPDKFRLMGFNGYTFWQKPSATGGEILSIEDSRGRVVNSFAIDGKNPNRYNKAMEHAKAWVRENGDDGDSYDESMSDTKTPAKTFKQYQYNQHDVCLNPTTGFSHKTKKIFCTITVCETPTGFGFGYSYGISGSDVGTGGSFGGPSYKYSSYKTIDAAILAAAKQAMSYFKRKDNAKFPIKDLKAIQDLIDTLSNREKEGFVYGWKYGGDGHQLYVYKPKGFNNGVTDNIKEAFVFESIEAVRSHYMGTHAIPDDHIDSLTNGYLQYFTASGQTIPTPPSWVIEAQERKKAKKPSPKKHSSKNKTQMLQSELQVVKLSAISASETNKLLREPWELEEPALKELTDSIREKGVIQPIVLRPNGKPGKFFLVCGERRFHASNFAGLKDIPALIKELTEDEAFDLQITENLQRKDVHPMKEAQAYRALIDANPEKNTVQEMAHRFGKSSEYIAQRLSFNNLLPEMKKEFAAGKMLIGHAIAFARLQEADQRECYVNCKPKYGPSTDQYEPVKTVDTFVMQKLVREINKGCFNPNDAELVATAGSCNTCPKRTGTNELFADIKEKDRCFDGACFEAKTSAHIVNRIAGLLPDNENLALIADHGAHVHSTVKKYIAKNSLRLLKEYSDYSSAAKTDKGAVKALCVAGANIGETSWIKLIKKDDEKKVSSVKGDGAKNTPAHFDEQIAAVKQLYKETVQSIQEETQEQMAERAKSLKPYVEPDPTPLNKYEMAIFYMALAESTSPQSQKRSAAIIKAMPVDKSLSKDEQLVEKWANIPQDLINFLIRDYVTCSQIEDLTHPAGIAFRKAVGGWKGVNLDKMIKEENASIEKAKNEMEHKVEALQAKKKDLNPKSKAAGK